MEIFDPELSTFFFIKKCKYIPGGKRLPRGKYVFVQICKFDVPYFHEFATDTHGTSHTY